MTGVTALSFGVSRLPRCAPFFSIAAMLAFLLFISNEPILLDRASLSTESRQHVATDIPASGTATNSGHPSYLEDEFEHSTWVGSRADWIRTFGEATWERCLVHLWLRCAVQEGSASGASNSSMYALHLRGFLHLEPLELRASKQPQAFALRHPVRSFEQLAGKLQVLLTSPGGSTPTRFRVSWDSGRPESVIHIEVRLERSGQPFGSQDTFHVALEGWPQAHELNAGRCQRLARLSSAASVDSGAFNTSGGVSMPPLASGHSIPGSSAPAAPVATAPAEPRAVVVLTPVVNKPFRDATIKAREVPLAFTAEALRVHAGAICCMSAV